MVYGDSLVSTYVVPINSEYSMSGRYVNEKEPLPSVLRFLRPESSPTGFEHNPIGRPSACLVR